MVKKEINPRVMIGVLVCVVVIAVFFLYRAATEKPMYPGYKVWPGGKPMTAESVRKMGASGAGPGQANPYAQSNTGTNTNAGR